MVVLGLLSDIPFEGNLLKRMISVCVCLINFNQGSKYTGANWDNIPVRETWNYNEYFSRS